MPVLKEYTHDVHTKAASKEVVVAVVVAVATHVARACDATPTPHHAARRFCVGSFTLFLSFFAEGTSRAPTAHNTHLQDDDVKKKGAFTALHFPTLSIFSYTPS